jgi:hypothetical protein
MLIKIIYFNYTRNLYFLYIVNKVSMGHVSRKTDGESRQPRRKHAQNAEATKKKHTHKHTSDVFTQQLNERHCRERMYRQQFSIS